MKTQKIRGYLIHITKVKASSAVAFLMTEQFGKLRVWIRGLKGSKTTPLFLLTPFREWIFSIEWNKKGEWHRLKEIEEPTDKGIVTAHWKPSLLKDFYTNELLLKTLEEEAPYPRLYQLYKASLHATEQKGAAIAAFEAELLAALGYALPFPESVEPYNYRFHPQSGFQALKADPLQSEGAEMASIYLAYPTLQAIKDGKFHTPILRKTAHKLFWSQISWHLSLPILNSLKLINTLKSGSREPKPSEPSAQ